VSWAWLSVGGKQIRVAIVRAGEGVWVGWSGQSKYFGPECSPGTSAEAVEREVRAPMTGRVALVGVAPGARVRINDVLVVLEAMKMEYRLAAPRDGVIESVGCKEGDRVDLGHVLVRLAP
jgi:acetyl/propionyl-CoA carboxylase alpha subunit